jgi:hypothetical protein
LGAPGRLIIWCRFKSTFFFMYAFSKCLVRAVDANFLLAFTFRKVRKESLVEN